MSADVRTLQFLGEPRAAAPVPDSPIRSRARPQNTLYGAAEWLVVTVSWSPRPPIPKIGNRANLCGGIFNIDAERQGRLGPLAKGVPPASSDTDVTGDSEKSLSGMVPRYLESDGRRRRQNKIGDSGLGKGTAQDRLER